MQNHPVDESPLTEDEAAALRSLRGDVPPPADLEDRVVEAVGLVTNPVDSGRRSGRRHWLVWATAAAAVFVAGRVSVGSVNGVVSDEAVGARFALFLLAGDDFRPAGRSAEASRVREYSDWAARLTEEGRYQSGEELAPDAGRVISLRGEPGRMPTPSMVGMFIIRATNLDGAVAIAHTLPHLRHGGTVAVVPVVEH